MSSQSPLQLHCLLPIKQVNLLAPNYSRDFLRGIVISLDAVRMVAS
jgi:hypothetical protein